ncbi:hypothetical protein AX16_006103 [Volvariella volvacea WC 439]|nr:hypothetical protein AX16_006103 [Volvariella volvacea WC 439]
MSAALVASSPERPSFGLHLREPVIVQTSDHARALLEGLLATLPTQETDIGHASATAESSNTQLTRDAERLLATVLARNRVEASVQTSDEEEGTSTDATEDLTDTDATAFTSATPAPADIDTSHVQVSSEIRALSPLVPVISLPIHVEGDPEPVDDDPSTFPPPPSTPEPEEPVTSDEVDHRQQPVTQLRDEHPAQSTAPPQVDPLDWSKCLPPRFARKGFCIPPPSPPLVLREQSPTSPVSDPSVPRAPTPPIVVPLPPKEPGAAVMVSTTSMLISLAEAKRDARAANGSGSTTPSNNDNNARDQAGNQPGNNPENGAAGHSGSAAADTEPVRLPFVRYPKAPTKTGEQPGAAGHPVVGMGVGEKASTTTVKKGKSKAKGPPKTKEAPKEKSTGKAKSKGKEKAVEEGEGSKAKGKGKSKQGEEPNTQTKTQAGGKGKKKEEGEAVAKVTKDAVKKETQVKGKSKSKGKEVRFGGVEVMEQEAPVDDRQTPVAPKKKAAKSKKAVKTTASKNTTETQDATTQVDATTPADETTQADATTQATPASADASPSEAEGSAIVAPPTTTAPQPTSVDTKGKKRARAEDEEEKKDEDARPTRRLRSSTRNKAITA